MANGIGPQIALPTVVSTTTDSPTLGRRKRPLKKFTAPAELESQRYEFGIHPRC